MTEHLDRDTRREQILDAASKMFIAQGYENSSVDDIAKLAGLSKGSIYWYFRSKLEILFELTDRCVEESQREIVRLASIDKYGLEALYKSHRDLYQLDLQYPDREMLYSQLYALAPRYPEINERLKEYHRRWDATTTRLFEDAVNKGQFRPVDAMRLGQAISALYNGLHIRKQIDPEIDMIAVLETATKLFYDALIVTQDETASVEDKG
ncbi:MAG TPA: TetR/AcrR family transcriptional regulator [bacterium]|jgi:TetR/AcrR family acrAB operon transcriptional repressor